MSALSFNPNCGACGGLNFRGYCQYTACRFPVSKETGITKPVSGTLIKPKPKTNADKIRAMSDEELAEFIWSIGMNIGGWTYINGKPIFDSCKGNGWLDWLRREAEE